MKKMTLLLSLFCGLTVNAQWSLTGNAGTNPTVNFIGTTDSNNLVFKTNNIEWMRITPTGRFVLKNTDTGGYGSGKNLFFGGGNDNAGGTNTAFGIATLTNIASGNWNVAVGSNSQRGLQTGNNNTSIGTNSLLFMETGSDNTAVGNGSLNTLQSGNYNTVLGSGSISSVTEGSYNIVIGYRNLSGISGISNNNIFIGNNIQSYSSAPNQELNIGNWIVGNNGTIGIGQFTNQLPADGIAQDGLKYNLFVKDGIKTEKVKVDIAASNGWADYVFKKDYKLMPLKDVEHFINNNGHLPEVPSTEEAIKNGIELKEMNILLLKKIEELTLYTIEQQKRIEALEKKLK